MTFRSIGLMLPLPAAAGAFCYPYVLRFSLSEASQRTRRKWAALEGVAESQLYVWIDFACIEQDDVAELVRGVNSLAL